ncbi:MAG: tRNA/rRNA methyltransferase [Crocinitomicaceae bacterium]|nr:MAG: tRNA/rRNA methyltransferase [Crocinitomicaceae bacterium]
MNRKLKLEELNRLSITDFKSKKKDPIVVLLDNVRSLHNVGSVFRTCDAMAVEKLYLGGITAKPPHREIQKTAIGATESVKWEYVENAESVVLKYKNLGYKIIAVEQTVNSTDLTKYKWNDEKTMIIFGNEVNGVQQNIIDMADLSIEIPQWGTKHSLNISVSAGIILWDLKSKLG